MCRLGIQFRASFDDQSFYVFTRSDLALRIFRHLTDRENMLV